MGMLVSPSLYTTKLFSFGTFESCPKYPTDTSPTLPIAPDTRDVWTKAILADEETITPSPPAVTNDAVLGTRQATGTVTCSSPDTITISVP